QIRKARPSSALSAPNSLGRVRGRPRLCGTRSVFRLASAIRISSGPALSRYGPIGTPFPSTTIMTLVPLPTLVFPLPFPLFWQEQIDQPEKLEPIRFSLPHPFDPTAHAKSAPTSRLPTIASIAANRWWENHIAGAC